MHRAVSDLDYYGPSADDAAQPRYVIQVPRVVRLSGGRNRGTGIFRCPNCEQTAELPWERSEDGIDVDMDTMPCHDDDCNLKLCPQCDRAKCFSCDLMHCREHLWKTVEGLCCNACHDWAVRPERRKPAIAAVALATPNATPAPEEAA